MFSFRLEERIWVAKDAILKALQDGRLTRDRLKESYDRVKNLKRNHHERNQRLGIPSDDVLACTAHQELIKEIEAIVPPTYLPRNTSHRIGSDVQLKKDKKCQIS
jgi:hypothetical protein